MILMFSVLIMPYDKKKLQFIYSYKLPCYQPPGFKQSGINSNCCFSNFPTTSPENFFLHCIWLLFLPIAFFTACCVLMPLDFSLLTFGTCVTVLGKNDLQSEFCVGMLGVVSDAKKKSCIYIINLYII